MKTIKEGGWDRPKSRCGVVLRALLDTPLRPGALRLGSIVLGLLLSSAMLSGCALREHVRRVCVDVEASQNLNFYDGNPHSLTVLVYALSDQRGFQAVPISELLAGHVPSGVLEPPVPFTIEPGAKMSLEHVFPAATRSIGLVADYDRVPDRLEGVAQASERRIVLPSRCGFLAPRLRLSETQIEGA